MNAEKREETLGKLKLELDILDKGAYNPSVHEPRSVPRIFRDSVSCLNLGLNYKVEPCSNCYLMQFVPPQYANAAEPCQHIPLNERGETVASLSAKGDQDLLQSTLRDWLQRTIARLEEECAEANSEKKEALLLSAGDRQSCLPQRR